MLVETVLERKGRTVHTIAPTATIAEAAKALNRNRIGVLVVRDALDRIVGILSERDIVRTVGEMGARALAFSVADLMTYGVHTCQSSDSIDDVMLMMVRSRIRHVPVLDSGSLIGLLSVRDLLAERLQQQAATVDSLLTLNRCRPAGLGYAGRLTTVS